MRVIAQAASSVYAEQQAISTKESGEGAVTCVAARRKARRIARRIALLKEGLHLHTFWNLRVIHALNKQF
jgi:hypothetical protein